MREFDALASYPQATTPRIANRTITNKIVACYRDREFFDGDRANGYGGLLDDGRWNSVAEFMAREYELKKGSTVLQLQSEKGFLVNEFLRMGIEAWGEESSEYACEKRVTRRNYIEFPVTELGWGDLSIDLVIAIGIVYTLALKDAIKCLREIQRVGRRTFITLGAYEIQEDYWLMHRWSLLGCTILRKDEWIEVMKHAGYDGDYKFVTAESLGLC